jgi:hypothetical protein
MLQIKLTKKMKTIYKIILAASALLFITVNVRAQDMPVRFGVKAGVNLSNFTGDLYQDAKNRVGFNAGITMDYAFTENWYLMTGLEFTTKGAKAVFTESIPGVASAKETYKMSPSYLELPIHAGYKLGLSESTNLVLHAGPYLAYGLGGKVKYDGKSVSENGVSQASAESNFFGKDGMANRFDFGLGIGAGLEFGNIGVDLGYDFGLVNITKKMEGIKPTTRTANAYLSVGYKF